MAEEFKATAVFVCGINPHPVTKLDGVHSARVGKMFAPCVYGKARLPDNVREYEVDFPISVADADSLEKLEELRKALHDRLDITFQAYIKKWEAASKILSARAEKAVIKEVTEENADEQGEKGGETDSVDPGS
jgi:hypothetical protein